jgi:hypothetical protein
MSKKIKDIIQVRYANTGQAVETDEASDLYSMYTHIPWDAAIQDVSRAFEGQYWYFTNESKLPATVTAE